MEEKEKDRGILEDRLQRLQIQEAIKREEDQGPNITAMSKAEGHESPKKLSPMTLEGNSESVVDLPDELVMAILLRLPIKSIVRSLCVCKRWLSIIKNHAFISAHLALSISSTYNNYIFVSWERIEEKKFLLITDNNNVLTHHAELKIPFESRTGSLFLVGSCNGLVCLTDHRIDHHGRDIYLVNPSIQKYMKLNAEYSCYFDLFDDVGGNVALGFGYCGLENDYKVVRIFKYITYSDPPVPVVRNIKAEVYSLKSGKWKVINVPVDIYMPSFVSGTFVDGCLYWLPGLRDDPYFLHCFDLHTEVFREIQPPATHHELLRVSSFTMLKKIGSLALFIIDPRWEDFFRLCVFVMERDTNGQVNWKEFIYDTDNYDALSSHIVGFSRTGRLIYWEGRPERIAAINFDDLSAVEKLRLDPEDNTNYEEEEPVSYSTDDTNEDECVKQVTNYWVLEVDVNFVESLVLLLE